MIPSGSFRQLIGRYDEASLLYAKMMHVHILVNQVRGDRYRKRAAREELWKGQAGHAYWHGKCDGIYRRSIRQSAYSSLIEAEKTTRERGIFKPYTGREDFDMDGLHEYLFNGNEINAYLHLQGGVLFEFDYLPVAWNYLDTMSRYEEPYHEAVLPSGQFDTGPRRGFVDRFEKSGFSFDEYIKGVFDSSDQLSEHVYEVYEYKRDHMEVGLETEWNGSLSLKKHFRLVKNAMQLDYTITNISPGTEQVCFLSELPLAFASNNEEFLQVRAHESSGNVLTLRDAASANTISRFEARDLRNAVVFGCEVGTACDLYTSPISTTWISRIGIKTGYQCTSFCLRWTLDLEPGESVDVPIILRVSR